MNNKQLKVEIVYTYLLFTMEYQKNKNKNKTKISWLVKRYSSTSRL